MSELAVYIHWPYCLSKCPYCDFNSYEMKVYDVEEWKTAYIKELNFYKTELPNHKLRTIFFGGGTPSLMPPQLVESLINTISQLWTPKDNVEITLEANPSTVENARLQDFKLAGVNRLSLGVQALSDEALQFLGRKHTLAETLAAMDIVKNMFPRYSFDLIYARPNQTLEAWLEELERVLNYEPDHISFYQLTIEDGTKFKTLHGRGAFTLPDEETSVRLYESTTHVLAERGLRDYEVSNYAKPGYESQHNLTYWRYEDFIGVGPGAHGRIRHSGYTLGTQNIKTPQNWLKALRNQPNGLVDYYAIPPIFQGVEYIMLGLRLKEGICLIKLKNLLQASIYTCLNEDKLYELQEGGFLIYSNTRLRTTLKGRLCLNQVLEHIIYDSVFEQ